MEAEATPIELSRRWVPYVLGAILSVVAAVWLGQSLLSPHTATARIELEIDTSNGSEWPPARWRDWPRVGWQGIEGVVSNLGTPRLAAEAALVLRSSVDDGHIDAGYMFSRSSIQAARSAPGLEVRFSADNRVLARAGADAMVVAVREFMAEAQPSSGPRWVVTSTTLADTTSNLNGLVIALYAIGAGALLLAIPRSWWSDQTPLVASKGAAGGLLAAGVIGAVAFGLADLAGYGYPGFGTVQMAGLGVMSAAAVVGALEMVRRRSVGR